MSQKPTWHCQCLKFLIQTFTLIFANLLSQMMSSVTISLIQLTPCYALLKNQKVTDNAVSIAPNDIYDIVVINSLVCRSNGSFCFKSRFVYLQQWILYRDQPRWKNCSSNLGECSDFVLGIDISVNFTVRFTGLVNAPCLPGKMYLWNTEEQGQKFDCAGIVFRVLQHQWRARPANPWLKCLQFTRWY